MYTVVLHISTSGTRVPHGGSIKAVTGSHLSRLEAGNSSENRGQFGMVPNPPSPHPRPPLWCPRSMNFSQVVSLHPNTSECYPPFLLFPLESSFLGKPFSIPASPLASSPCPSETWLFPEATSLRALAPQRLPEAVLESS